MSESTHEVALVLARSQVIRGIESSVSRVKNIVDDGKRVEHPSHAVEVVVGLRDRPDCVSSVAAKPRPDPLVAPEVFLKEGLAILDIATKPLGELGGVIEIEISISVSN